MFRIRICSALFLLILFYTFQVKALVYDCFTFFNEWELLEIRLNELYDYVDKFVIVESCESFRGLPKPYNFELKKSMYEKFMDKIIYVKIQERIGGNNDWVRENFQKNQVMRALKQCHLDDLVLFSDVDEIPPGELVAIAAEEVKRNPIIVFQQKMYRFYLNRMAPEEVNCPTSHFWPGTLAIRFDQLRRTLPNQLRTRICFENVRTGTIEWKGGWHFSSMGGFERFCEKCENWLHWRNPYQDTPEAFDEISGSYLLVPIDDTYPRFVQENLSYLIEKGLIDSRD